MKKLERLKRYRLFWFKPTVFLIILSLWLSAPASLWAKHVGGPVSGDWYNYDSPFIVDSTIIVLADDSLTIHEDVEVLFTKADSMIVYGYLYIDASVNRRVCFRMESGEGLWRGIFFYNASSQNSILKYCDIEESTHSIIISNSSPEIAYNNIYPQYSGIECFYSTSSIHHNNIQICYDEEPSIEVRGISFQHSDVIIYNNTIDVYNGNLDYFANTYGIYGFSSPILLFENRIYTTSYGKAIGVFGWGGMKDSIVYNEVIVSSEKLSVSAGIKLYVKQLSEIINNTIDISGPGQDTGILLDEAGSTIILNNIVNGDGISLGLNAVNASPYIIQYNDFSNHETASIGWILDDTNICDDPLFRGNTNPDSFYYLRPQSPCIDAGHPNPFYNDPDGTRNDMGTHYYELTTVVNNPPTVPAECGLLNCYPNPTNSGAMISFELPQSGLISLSIYDIMGRLVDNIYRGTLPAGANNYRWNGVENASGVYFVRLDGPSIYQVQRIVLMK